jgi:hypothetical protein
MVWLQRLSTICSHNHHPGFFPSTLKSVDLVTPQTAKQYIIKKTMREKAPNLRLKAL